MLTQQLSSFLLAVLKFRILQIFVVLLELNLLEVVFVSSLSSFSCSSVMILRPPWLFGLIFLLSSFRPLLAADSVSKKIRAEKDQHCYVCLNTRSWLHYLFPCLCNEPQVPGYNSKREQERFPFAFVVRQAKKEKRAKLSSGSKQKFTLFKRFFPRPLLHRKVRRQVPCRRLLRPQSAHRLWLDFVGTSRWPLPNGH